MPRSWIAAKITCRSSNAASRLWPDSEAGWQPAAGCQPALHQPAGTFENIAQHRSGQLARGGVLLAGMIRADQYGPPRSDIMLAIVSEGEARFRLSKYVQVSVKRESTQGDNHADAFQRGDFAGQVGPAIAEFLRSRLIVRRRAANSSGDVNVREFQAILA